MNNIEITLTCIVAYLIGAAATAWVRGRTGGYGMFNTPDGMIIIWPLLWLLWLMAAMFMYPFAGLIILIQWATDKGEASRLAAQRNKDHE